MSIIIIMGTIIWSGLWSSGVLEKHQSWHDIALYFFRVSESDVRR
jgi:hypothetical protein